VVDDVFHFYVSTVLTVERVINKTKPSFMQIFVYSISFVLGMQGVYQHHIWRLARNCNHSIKIWRKRKVTIRTHFSGLERNFSAVLTRMWLIYNRIS